MTKTELIAKLIVMGFKQTSSMTYKLYENNIITSVRFIHNQNVRVISNNKGQYCTYHGTLLWICENAKQN